MGREHRNVLKKITDYIKNTRMDFLCSGQHCASNETQVQFCPRDPHGDRNAFYSGKQNAVLICNFNTTWKPLLGSAAWNEMLAHELTHAKDHILGSLAVAAGHRRRKFTSQQSTGGSGQALPMYSASQYGLLRKYFKISRSRRADHDKQIAEFYGFLGGLQRMLGRANLVPEDFLIACEKNSPRIMASWKRKTPNARNLSADKLMDFELNFKSQKIWKLLRCRNLKGALKAVNSLARAERPKGPPRRMVS